MLPGSELINSEKKIILGSPALKLSRKWLQKVIAEDEAGRTYGDMTYNTFRRIVRRFHTEVLGYERAQDFEGWSYYKKGPKEGEQKEFFKAYGPLPSTPVSTLDFKKLGMPINRSYGEPFVGGFEEDDDDED
jgi:hypothetical protein